VDEETGDAEARAGKVQGQQLKMAPYAAAVLTIK